jgi:uncharacterized protein (DUF302 family)
MTNGTKTPRGYNISFFVGGLIVGIALTGFIIAVSLPRMMIEVYPSNLGFDETVTALQQAFDGNGWKVSHVYDIQQSLLNEGKEDIGRMKIFSVCKPDYAEKILNADDRKKISSMMPCRLSIYEAKSGRVYIAAINIGLMSKMFGGITQEVMRDVAKEQKEMLKLILEG